MQMSLSAVQQFKMVDTLAWTANLQTAPAAGAAPATGTPQNNVTLIGVPGSAPAAAGAAPAAGTTGVPGTQPPVGSPPPPGNSLMLFGPMIALLVVMVLMSIFQGRKEKKRQAELMSGLKRQDTVLTTSGIIGTIVDVSDEDVVLKVEDGRIRFAKRAVSQVIKPAQGAAAVVESKSAPKEGREPVRA